MSKEKINQYAKIAGVILIIYLIFHFFIFSKKSDEVKIQPPKVMTQKPKTINLAEYVYQTGNTVAYNSVDLVARIEGYLEGINFTDGSYVRKDKQLFVIQPLPYLEKLKQAEAGVMAAEAGLKYAKAEYARQKRMFQQNATSKNSVEVWLSKQEQAQAELYQAKANLVNSKINYSYTHVLAPFDGRIGRHLVDQGNLVGNGSATKLATIEQIAPIYVYFNLNELDLLKLRKAARQQGIKPENINQIPVYVGLQNENDFPHQGQLDFVDTGLDPTTGTLTFRAILKNENIFFVPGLFVKVRVPVSPAKPMLTVPASAVLYDQIGPYLLTVNDKQIVEQKYIKIGPKEQNRQSVKQGLTANDNVIVKGIQFATPGNTVKIINTGGKSS